MSDHPGREHASISRLQQGRTLLSSPHGIETSGCAGGRVIQPIGRFGHLVELERIEPTKATAAFAFLVFQWA
jgi:hypothetical protein